MARYTLTTDERRVLTSWLYEPNGYLDAAVNINGVSARQVLTVTPSTNITDWIRSNTKGLSTIQSDWDECSMCWYILANEGVNITNQNKPAEYNYWKTILTRWIAEINGAFVRASKAQRDLINVELYSQGGVITTMPHGTQFANQQSTGNKFSAL